MHPFIADQLVRARRCDFEREAAGARLAKQARSADGRSRRRARAAVGQLLVRAGVRLGGAPSGGHLVES